MTRSLIASLVGLYWDRACSEFMLSFIRAGRKRLLLFFEGLRVLAVLGAFALFLILLMFSSRPFDLDLVFLLKSRTMPVRIFRYSIASSWTFSGFCFLKFRSLLKSLACSFSSKA